MIPAPDVIPFDDCPVAPMEAPTGQIIPVPSPYRDLNIDKNGDVKVRDALESVKEYLKELITKPIPVSEDPEYGTLIVDMHIPIPFFTVTIVISPREDIMEKTRNFVDTFR